MKYKPLCRDYDIDISRRFVSCQYLRKLVYDKFQTVVHASLPMAYGPLIVLLSLYRVAQKSKPLSRIIIKLY